MPVVKASELQEYRSFVAYGRSGTGKTTLACTFPTPILLLDIKDRGTDSISDVEDVDVLPCNELEDIHTAYWYLKQNPDKYATVILDTVSQLQQLEVVAAVAKKKKSTVRAGDWGTMTKREWGDVAAEMKATITQFRDLPMNVVFIAQDRVFNIDEEDDSDNALTPEIGPRLSPSVASHLNASVSVIVNTFVRRREVKKKVGKRTKRVVKTEYCLRIGPHSTYITKIRKPRYIDPPEVLVDPDYENIMDIIKGV